MQEKLKSLLADDTVYMGLLVVLVAVVSFGLGRHSIEGKVASAQPAGVVFSEAVNEASSEGVAKAASPEKPEVKLVASKSGTKYHLLNCPGAGQIKEVNKLFFNSTAEAEAAGYSPASNCPGLKDI